MTVQMKREISPHYINSKNLCTLYMYTSLIVKICVHCTCIPSLIVKILVHCTCVPSLIVKICVHCTCIPH